MEVNKKKKDYTGKTKQTSNSIHIGTKEKQKQKKNPPQPKKSIEVNKILKSKFIRPFSNVRNKKSENKINLININDEKIIEDQNIIMRLSFFNQIKKKNWDKCICKLEVDKNNHKIYGTGFFCEIPSKEMKVLITNNHNIDSTVLSKRGKLKYFINNNGDEIEKSLNLGINRYIYIEKKNDFTIIEDEDCIDYFIKVEENNNEEDFLKYENVFTLQYPETKDLSFSSGQIFDIDEKNNEYLLYNIGLKKGFSGSPIILLKNLKIVGLHKGGSKQLNIRNEKINKGIIFKKIFDKIPHKDELIIEDNMIKCEYYIKKEI